MNFDNTLFRCSSLGHIMTEPRGKTETLSESCKTHLVDVYVANKYNRRQDLQNKYISKGLMAEEDSITLYSRVKKRFFLKNEQHLSNEFIKGTPDMFTGLEITHSDIVIDVKTSWDLYTFFRVHTQDINKMYYWQLQGYMALTGASKALLVYCLVNTPDVIINDEKRRLLWKMGVVTDENPDFIEACKELEHAMTFDDIPRHERVIEFEIERNDADIYKLYSRVKQCRTYLNTLEQTFNPSSVLLAEHDAQAEAQRIIDEENERIRKAHEEKAAAILAWQKKIDDEERAIELQKQKDIDDKNRAAEAEKMRLQIAENERLRLIEKQKQDKIAEEERLLLASDKVKFQTVITQLGLIKVPEMKSAKSKRLAAEVTEQVAKLTNYILNNLK